MKTDIETARQMLVSALQANVPVMLWGAPGIGKTSLVRAAARELSWPCQDVSCAVLQVEDLGGYARVSENGEYVDQVLAAWMREIPRDEPAVLLLDDLPDSLSLVQAAAFRLVLERAVGTVRFPALRIVAAGNPPELSAMGATLPPALANRMCHVEIDPSPAIWARAIDQFERDPAVQHELRWIAFMLSLPEPLAPPFVLREPTSEIAFPSPRAWHTAARLTAAGVPRVHAVTAACGSSAAMRVAQLLGNEELPAHGAWDEIERRAQEQERVAARLMVLGATVIDAPVPLEKVRPYAYAVGDIAALLPQHVAEALQ